MHDKTLSTMRILAECKMLVTQEPCESRQRALRGSINCGVETEATREQLYFFTLLPLSWIMIAICRKNF